MRQADQDIRVNIGRGDSGVIRNGGNGRATGHIGGQHSGSIIDAFLEEVQKSSTSAVVERRSGARRSGRVALNLCGQAGMQLVSLIMLIFTMGLFAWPLGEVVVMACALVVIRVVYFLARESKPVLSSYLVRKRLWHVVEDEVKFGVAFLGVCFVAGWTLYPVAVAVFLMGNFIAQVGWMYFSKRVMARIARDTTGDPYASYKRVIIVGTGGRAARVADTILDSPELDSSILGFMDFERKGLWRYRDVPLIGHPDEIGKVISRCQVDAIIVAVEPEELAYTQFLFSVAEQMGVQVCYVPVIHEPRISKAKPAYVNGTPVLLYRAIPENQLLLFFKRVMDVLGSLAGIVLTSPIMVAAVLAIKIDSPGPVLFRQVRSGLNGKLFTLYKFRTMCRDAEKKKKRLQAMNEMSGPVFKIANDPRVTRVGKTLRKLSIDELPQFFNVLAGSMSLVGPRPPLPKEVAQYKPWQRRKLSVKPGVTCIWQVNGRNRVDFEDWMKLDLEYIDNWSLWEDAKIIARTIPAVIKGSGAS